MTEIKMNSRNNHHGGVSSPYEKKFNAAKHQSAREAGTKIKTASCDEARHPDLARLFGFCGHKCIACGHGCGHVEVCSVHVLADQVSLPH